MSYSVNKGEKLNEGGWLLTQEENNERVRISHQYKEALLLIKLLGDALRKVDVTALEVVKNKFREETTDVWSG